MYTRVIISALVVWVPSQANAEDKPLNELKMLKVGIGTSKQEFLKLHPQARVTQRETLEDGSAVLTYVVKDDTGLSTFTFVDEELCRMSTQWEQPGIQKEMGWVPIMDKLVQKYGKPDVTDGKENSSQWRNSKCGMATLLAPNFFAVFWVSDEGAKKLKTVNKASIADKID